MDKTRQEAFSVVYKVLKDGHHSDKLLEQSAKKLSTQQEKAFLYHLVRGTIKMKKNLDYIAASLSDKKKYEQTDLKIKCLIYTGLYQLKFSNSVPDHSAVDETVEIAKNLLKPSIADYINALLRNYLRQPNIPYPENDVERLSVEHSFPENLIEEWINYWGVDETEMLCLYFNEKPKLSMRVNRIATDRGRFKKYMNKRGFELSESNCSDYVYTSESSQAVLDDVSFAEGYFTIQDASSAMVVELLDPKEDDSVLDLFAGPGGKCSYISEIMQNTGEVIAVDRFPKKTKLIRQTVHRLQIINTKIITEDALKYGPRMPAYDRVLLDVPCTGWGVLQKKPELRWQRNQDLKSLLKLQENALEVGAQFLKDGGTMVYSTCTLNHQENEQQVERFLEKYPCFKLIPANNKIQERYVDKGFLKTLPHQHLLDGVFAAKFLKA